MLNKATHSKTKPQAKDVQVNHGQARNGLARGLCPVSQWSSVETPVISDKLRKLREHIKIENSGNIGTTLYKIKLHVKCQ